jgi:hypothetical protein
MDLKSKTFFYFLVSTAHNLMVIYVEGIGEDREEGFVAS